MMERITESSPRFLARSAGVFYLLNILTGLFALVLIRNKLIVYGDATTTATNILTHEPLFRLGFAVDLLTVACYITVTGLFYCLFKPVNRSLSITAAFFSLVGCVIQASSCLFLVAPLFVLGGGQYLSVFSAEQLQTLALLFLKFHGGGYKIALVFFGFYCLLIGTLIFRSTFLPRILGAFLSFASLGWLTFLLPPLADSLSPYILLPGLLGEGALTGWLLVKGVNVQRWQEQNSAAGAFLQSKTQGDR